MNDVQKGIQTAAQISMANELKKQTAMMEEQRRQEQIQTAIARQKELQELMSAHGIDEHDVNMVPAYNISPRLSTHQTQTLGTRENKVCAGRCRAPITGASSGQRNPELLFQVPCMSPRSY